MSGYVKQHLPIILVNHLTTEKSVQNTLTSGFVEVDKSLGNSRIDCEFSGTTAVVSYLKVRAPGGLLGRAAAWCCTVCAAWGARGRRRGAFQYRMHALLGGARLPSLTCFPPLLPLAQSTPPAPPPPCCQGWALGTAQGGPLRMPIRAHATGLVTTLHAPPPPQTGRRSPLESSVDGGGSPRDAVACKVTGSRGIAYLDAPHPHCIRRRRAGRSPLRGWATRAA